MLDLVEELQKLIIAFDRHGLDYALCGGLALAIYDYPRATADIDLLIPAESLDQVIAIAKDLDYTIRGLDMTFVSGAIEIRRVSKIDPETGFVLSLDMILVTAKIQAVWDTRVQADWEGGRLSVVSRKGLIELKRMSARPQDLVDISALMRDVTDATD
jgi:hypothetical protein